MKVVHETKVLTKGKEGLRGGDKKGLRGGLVFNREHQEVTGFVHFPKETAVKPRDIHVVAEGWPSWLPAVLATGYLPAQIYSNKKKRDQTFFETALKERWMLVEEARGLSRAEIVFLSGSEKFVLEWCSSHGSHNVIAVVESSASHRGRVAPGLRGLHWKRLLHADLGGVTDCSAGVGFGAQIPSNWEVSASYGRTLRHVLAPATKLLPGRAHTKRGAGQEVGGEDRLPFRHPLTPVRCPSVYTGTKLVSRSLSVRELADCFDLPMELSSAFKQAFGDAEVDHLPFLGTTPIKILWAVAHKVLRSNEGNTIKMETEVEVVGGAEGESSAEEIRVETVTDEEEEETKEVRREIKDEQGQEEAPEEAGEDRKKRELKAAKGDDAAVPVYLWNDRIYAGLKRITPSKETDQALEHVRGFLKARWCRVLTRSFTAYLREQYGPGWTQVQPKPDSELFLDLEAGRDCLVRAGEADWWEWLDGSRPFFWRWPKNARTDIRDGMRMWQTTSPPTSRHPQPPPKDEYLKAKMRDKLKTVRKRRYICKGGVKNTTTYFGVPKGEDDIRVVYDATSSGLNDTLWAPSFGLPTVDSVLRAVEFCTWLGDNDLGEMFLNFVLSKDIREYAGIDLTPYFESELKTSSSVLWERWERCMMGLTTSPYQAVRAFLWGEEIMRGERTDPNNIFRWDELRLNLPGSAKYDPTKPWVSKIRTSNQRIAADFFCYIDDVRPCGSSEEECWQASRRVASICGYLGIQDAARKRRPPSQTPGAWAGSVVAIASEGPGVSVSQEKWDKTRRYLSEIMTELDETGKLEHKALEKKRGFLVYVTRTYPAMVPYLKGVHLTLDSWRPYRGEEGWKLSDSEIKANRLYGARELGELEFDFSYDSQAPSTVSPVTRLRDDIQALLKLTNSEKPPTRLIRSKRIIHAKYGFGDASGGGFGASIEAKKGLWYRHGIWGADVDGESSNYRELRNLVDSLEKLAALGEVEDSELFLFTDNTVAEAAFYRGTSSNRKLFDLILRLRKLEMSAKFRLHVLHVPGTRMIAQGADGLSRGNLTEGVMTGKDIRWFVPLNRSAIARAPSLIRWVRSWTQEDELKALEPEEWYSKGQDMMGGEKNADGIWIPRFEAGTRLWVPPPAAADVAIEQLRYARHRRQNSMHIFVCPRLCTHTWRRWLHKEADFVCEIPAGVLASWKKDQHEPLILGICFPFSSNRPWKLRGHETMVEMQREMREMCKVDGFDTVTFLRKLRLQARCLGSV